MSLTELPESPNLKELGAYYTHPEIARFLVSWAVRLPSDVVLDPSFGGGVFLHAASVRVAGLGGDPSSQVHGIELDPESSSLVIDRLRGEYGLRHLRQGNFFDFAPGVAGVDRARTIPSCDAVVGNPPFIRYQNFAGASRSKALLRAAEAGVSISQLASSWAPFVVHGISMLRPGGRLAMVVPYELLQAGYAKPVLEHISAQFARTTILMFDSPLFPDLSEATVLVLADERGTQSDGTLRVENVRSAFDLKMPFMSTASSIVDVSTILSGERRAASLHLPDLYSDLYAEVRKGCSTLGEMAAVGIGYVTGANEFFHVSPATRRRYALPDELLVPAVCRGTALQGAVFRPDDWRDALAAGASAYLLRIENGAMPESLRHYLMVGESKSIHERYKCRSRTPWFRVPHVYMPDALLTYMSGQSPRLVANDAGVVAPNTLHVVRMKAGSPGPRALAVLWQTSVARLSAQLEGHSMGGGMLKLEPREAQRVLLPMPHRSDLGALSDEIDECLRRGRERDARRLADEATLIPAGMSRRDCDRMAAAAQLLIEKRTAKIRADDDLRSPASDRSLGSAHLPGRSKGLVRVALPSSGK